jgi:hypothetical protein
MPISPRLNEMSHIIKIALVFNTLLLRESEKNRGRL